CSRSCGPLRRGSRSPSLPSSSAAPSWRRWSSRPQRKASMLNRDYTIIIDKSGSMATKDQTGQRSRWAAARESTEAFARRCEELDPDGLTLYVFASKFRRYDNVTADRVGGVFVENEPCGGTDLAGVLEHSFDAYFERKAKG